ncbi:MAG: hypothetical protein E7341_01080 [Clostridiales bacterium]|nr:hypothetical protein [Clostridiales bacterium]
MGYAIELARHFTPRQVRIFLWCEQTKTHLHHGQYSRISIPPASRQPSSFSLAHSARSLVGYAIELARHFIPRQVRIFLWCK